MVDDIDELKDRVGDARKSVTGFRVEAGKVAEFARSIGDDNPIYRDEAAARGRGFPAIPAPPTFTRVSMFPRYRPTDAPRLGIDIGFDIRREIHGEQEYVFERSAYVGDVLEGTTTLTDVFQRDGSRGGTMTFASLETAFYDENGELVVVERSTIIETEREIDDGDDATDDDEFVGPRIDGATVSKTVSGDGSSTYIEDVSEGDTVFEAVVENVTRSDFVRYAGASGDFNPIHYDEAYARNLGNPRVFGQGMLTAGYASHVASDWLDPTTVRRFKSRFRNRIWPGDTVTVTGTVRSVDPDSRRVVADVHVDRQSGDRVLDGEVEAELSSRPTG